MTTNKRIDNEEFLADMNDFIKAQGSSKRATDVLSTKSQILDFLAMEEERILNGELILVCGKCKRHPAPCSKCQAAMNDSRENALARQRK